MQRVNSAGASAHSRLRLDRFHLIGEYERSSALPAPHRVIVVGGGFAGIQVVRGLKNLPLDVIMIDRRNFTLFQPLLYQVATGLLSPANIATPLRPLFKRQSNASILLDEVTGFSLFERTLHLRHGDLSYDTLVLATGSRHHYFGHPEWETHAPGLKTIEDAEEIRARIFTALENAEQCSDPEQRRRQLTFVIAGGGPTSVELAGAVAEIMHRTTLKEFRRIEPRTARIVIIEAAPRLLGGFSSDSSAEAKRALIQLGVEVMLSTRITDVRADGVTVIGSEGERRLEAGTILWGAGVLASPLGALVAKATDLVLSSGGRVPVLGDCTVPGHPEVFVLGDLAAFEQDGVLLPAIAQVAIQQGHHAARTIAARAAHAKLPRYFRYQDKGSMATIGKSLAVAEIGGLHLRGHLAWFAWLALHVMKLMLVEHRLIVALQWAWSYITWNRNARLITGRPLLETIPSEQKL